jgi:ATP-dependent DNA ligase
MSRFGTNPGNDLTHRFPLIVETLARLRSRSCIIEGEAAADDHVRLPWPLAVVAEKLTPEIRKEGTLMLEKK